VAEPAAHETASQSPSGASPASGAETLYAAAHEAHFHGTDYAAALAAWDRYLAAAPQGRFVVEAKFNRAIALVKLERFDDAVAALRPFADGEVLPQNYRRDEAARLIERIERR
jgi:hypothetical protein